MNDLISRQAAIDALRYGQHRFTVADEADGLGIVKWSEDVIYFSTAERIITELPSAQPEPIKINIDYELAKDEYEKLQKDLANAPIVLLPERKKGRWNGKPILGYSTVRCSICNEVFLENDGTWNYCPNCGANMR